ncbi:MAG: hypothetical protein HC851_02245 [Acaryochloris sp. RU_4_1]|nr:hypothetical protein [Acaryochloris sp. RU_4_1]NJR56413.1 hypothetical protein [Acaryochloris sp. CRU_2_0]
MPLNQTLICRYCGYDANPDIATHCEICNQPLSVSQDSSRLASSKRSSAFRWGTLLVGLLILGGGGYLLWKNNRVSSPTTPSVSLTPELGLYNSMQAVKNVPAGLFEYGGALLFAALTTQGMNDAITTAHPGFQLRYREPLNSNPGTNAGITMLIDEQLSFAHSTRSLKDAELDRARSRGFALEQVAVALDGLAFYTHPAVDLQGLSIQQLQDIFLGKITNWRAVGGPDLEIVPILPDPKTINLFDQLFEGKKEVKPGENARILRDFTTSIRTVATTPGAISLASVSLVNQQKSVRLLAIAKGNSNSYISPVSENGQTNAAAFRDGSYPLTRRLFVIIRRDGSIDEQAGVAYANFVLSKEGQRIVKKAGFVPLRQVN